MAYSMWVDARARDLRGDIESAIDELDDELGIRPHWRKRRAAAAGQLPIEQRVAYLRGRTIRVEAPVRAELARPVIESRVHLPPPVGVG